MARLNPQDEEDEDEELPRRLCLRLFNRILRVFLLSSWTGLWRSILPNRSHLLSLFTRLLKLQIHVWFLEASEA